jgi:hypothetical protein
MRAYRPSWFGQEPPRDDASVEDRRERLLRKYAARALAGLPLFDEERKQKRPIAMTGGRS